MDSEDLEKLLESVFDVDTEDIVVSENTPLPCKLIWIVSDGSYVTKDQIIAILTPSNNNDVVENPENVSNQQGYKQPDDLQYFENIGDLGRNNLILRSNTNGKFVKIVENLTELYNTDEVLGRIEASFCNHEVVVHGLCANCSTHVESSFKRKHEDLSLRTDPKMTPGFITNHTGFEIDADLAYDMECSEISKYLNDRKLCLVLDLDNTLLHATSQKAPIDIDIDMIEVSSPECKKDLDYIHNSSEDDPESIKLQHKLESSVLKTIVFNESETTCCHSYFKLRPGVFNFFRKASKNYKLFLFTMGTKQHANSALEVLDPKGVYLGNRVFCRNDSKSCMKSLDRIFPKHKNLVLVVDDSEYVWTNNLGLIKVHPYYYFPDLTYLNNFDLNNLTKSSAALQSICNYSNFIWSKLIHTSNNNTGSSSDEKSPKNNENSKKIDQDGFAVPTIPKKTHFRYNGYLICNERPADIYTTITTTNTNNFTNNTDSNSSSTNKTSTTNNSSFKGNNELFKKIRIKDNDRQLDKLIKLLDNIYTNFYHEYDTLLHNLSNNGDQVNEANLENHTHLNNKTHSFDNNKNNLENSLSSTHLNGNVDLYNNASNNTNIDTNTNNSNNNNTGFNENNLNDSNNMNYDNNNENNNKDNSNSNNNSSNTNKTSTTTNKFNDQNHNHVQHIDETDIKYLMDNKLLPKACMILKDIRESILNKLTLYSNTCEFINISLRNRSGGEDVEYDDIDDVNFLLCSDFGKWAMKFGATISNRLINSTHVIVNNRNSMVLLDTSLKKVHIKWLEAVFYCFEHVDEQKFNPDNWKTPYRSFWDVLES